MGNIGDGEVEYGGRGPINVRDNAGAMNGVENGEMIGIEEARECRARSAVRAIAEITRASVEIAEQQNGHGLIDTIDGSSGGGFGTGSERTGDGETERSGVLEVFAVAIDDANDGGNGVTGIGRGNTALDEDGVRTIAGDVGAIDEFGAGVERYTTTRPTMAHDDGRGEIEKRKTKRRERRGQGPGVVGVKYLSDSDKMTIRGLSKDAKLGETSGGEPISVPKNSGGSGGR